MQVPGALPLGSAPDPVSSGRRRAIERDLLATAAVMHLDVDAASISLIARRIEALRPDFGLVPHGDAELAPQSGDGNVVGLPRKA